MPVEVVLGYVGNWGNVMLQLFIVARLEALLGPLGVTADDPKVREQLRQLGRELPLPMSRPEERFVARARFRDARGIVEGFRRAALPAIELRTCNLRYGEWPTLAQARAMFPARAVTPLFAPDELVVSVRGGNILRGIHRDYVVPPVSFYRYLAERTGLRLAFFGQIADDPYSAALQQAFPQARFIGSLSPDEDFAQLRQARHLVPAISTFSILAAWLSEAEAIHLPLLGGLNPFQRPDSDNVPADDPRYTFYQFPLLFMEPIETLLPDLERRANPFAPIAAEALRRRIAEWPYYRLPLEQGLAVLDEDYYAAAYADVRPQAAAAGIGVADHYRRRGHARHRLAAPVDPLAYARAYPDAARAIGYGEYRNCFEHWALAGRFSGYLPDPVPHPR